MATTTIIPLHAGKGRSVATALGMSVDYIENPDKTNSGQWVTAFECDPLIADNEFLFSKRQYAAITGRNQGARDVIGYHLRISFKPGETDAATANKIGYDLALKLTHGNHAFVCCTHTDKQHIHSHIVINSTSLDCTRKFRNFKGSSFVIRRIADHLCIENGLSIITNPKPSRGSYANWQGDEGPLSNREKLEQIIDTALQNCKDYDTFIAAMKAAGCEVKHGKNLSIKIPGAERFARCKSLGADYTEGAILERISGKRIVAPKPKTAMPVNAPAKPNMLIDIQEKLQQGYGAGFEYWARIENLKRSAKTLIYLQEVGLKDYDDLAKAAAESSVLFNELSAKIKANEKRLAEISELQKYIGTYSKTHKTYQQYRASGWDTDFFEQFRADITLHKAAKKYFDSLGYGKNKKLPSINSLKQEYAKLASVKGKLYSEYKQARKKMIEIKTAKQNVDTILGEPRQPSKTYDRDAR